MNLFHILAICGMVSPILYTLMWILGGFLRSDYNHIRDDVSSLIAVGAPRKRFFDSSLLELIKLYPPICSLIRIRIKR